MGRPALLDRSTAANIVTLRPDYRAMARMVAIGSSNKDLCEQFGLQAPRVSAIINSPLFKAEVARLQEGLELALRDGAVELQAMQSRALEVIATDLYSDMVTKQRTKVAFEVLDRTGLGKKGDDGPAKGPITINYFAPRPGDNPEEAMKKVKEASASIEVEFFEDNEDEAPLLEG